MFYVISVLGIIIAILAGIIMAIKADSTCD